MPAVTSTTDPGPAPLRWSTVVAAAAILGLYVASRLAFAARFPYFLDEGTYAVFAADGARSLSGLFSSFSIGREPLMFWLAIPWVKLGLNPLDAVRAVSVVAGLLTLVVVAVLARRVGGGVAGWIAAVLCVVLPFFVVHDAIGIIEPLVTLAMAAALWLQIEFARRPRMRTAIALAIVIALALLTKENARPALVLLPLSLLCFDWSTTDRGARLRTWLGGATLTLVAAAAAQGLLRSSSAYGQYVAARENPLLYTVRSVRDVVSDPFGVLDTTWAAYHPAFTGYVTVPLLLAAAIGAVLVVARDRCLGALLLAWIALPLAISLLFSTAPFPRHVMYVMPPLVVLAAVAFADGAGWLRGVLPARRAAAVAGAVALLALVPALRLDAAVLRDPATARYPGLDDLQYVTGTGGGTPWEPMAAEIRRRARGDRVVMLAPTAYTQVIEMLLGSSRRYQVVTGRSPLASRAQFAISDQIPFFDPTAAEVMRREQLTVIARYPRPRGGASATLSGRP